MYFEERGKKMNLSTNRSHKFGIFQSSDVSCVFYKEDEDGNQSTFNIFVLNKENKNRIFAFIDNCQMDKEVWYSDNKFSMNDAIKVFNDWAVDSPILFEIEAQKSLSNCFKNFMFQKQD